MASCLPCVCVASYQGKFQLRKPDVFIFHRWCRRMALRSRVLHARNDDTFSTVCVHHSPISRSRLTKQISRSTGMKCALTTKWMAMWSQTWQQCCLCDMVYVNKYVVKRLHVKAIKFTYCIHVLYTPINTHSVDYIFSHIYFQLFLCILASHHAFFFVFSSRTTCILSSY